MFKEIKIRDTWSNLRGFVYQVNMTELGLLIFDDKQVFELEKGEDLDITNQENENKKFHEKWNN